MGNWIPGVDGLSPGEIADGIETASKRQFDDEPGGGALDPDTWIPGMDSPGSDAEVPDDEGMWTAPEDQRGDGFANTVLLDGLGSIPRQFDDREGGGFADFALDRGDDATEEVLPEWLRELLGRPKLLVTLVAAAAALSLLGPVLELAANATE